MTQQPPIQRLIEIMARLRDPQSGCPWDSQQTFRTIAPYTIEEAFEVADAIERGDLDSLKDELGDLLFQVVFHAHLAAEAGAFGFNEVAESISDKLVRRHPHVFGEATVDDADHQTAAWEQIKAHERERAGATSHLDGIPRGMPALRRAVKLQQRASRAGFDWDRPRPVFYKIREELDELQSELDNGGLPDRLEDEIGDLLFAVINLARLLKVDPGNALRRSNYKFERRFRAMETEAGRQGKAFEDLDLDAQEALWREVKGRE